MISLDDYKKYLEFSLEDFRAYQLAQLTSYVKEISKRSPYYSRRLANSRAIESYDQFSKLPLLEQTDLRERSLDDFLAVPGQEVLSVSRSSGSTGKSKLVLWSQASLKEQRFWCTLGFLLSGLKPHSRLARLTPTDMSILFSINLGVCENLDSMCIPIGQIRNDIDMDNAISYVKDLAATHVVGSPARLLAFTDRIEKLGYDPKQDFKVTHFISGGTTITARQRTTLENKWGAELFNVAGSNETNYIAFECARHDGMHLLPGISYVEVIDRDTQKPLYGDSKSGEIIITQFVNSATPLLRYRIGDTGYITYSKCPCGLSFPRLYITGRISGTIVIGGTKMYAYQIEKALNQFPWATMNYQVIVDAQNGVDTVMVLIESQLPDESSQHLKDEFVKILTHDPAVVFAMHDKIRNGVLRVSARLVEIGSLERTDRDKVKNQYWDLRT